MMEKRKISKLVCLLVMMLAIAAPCDTYGQKWLKLARNVGKKSHLEFIIKNGPKHPQSPLIWVSKDVSKVIRDQPKNLYSRIDSERMNTILKLYQDSKYWQKNFESQDILINRLNKEIYHHGLGDYDFPFYHHPLDSSYLKNLKTVNRFVQPDFQSMAPPQDSAFQIAKDLFILKQRISKSLNENPFYSTEKIHVLEHLSSSIDAVLTKLSDNKTLSINDLCEARFWMNLSFYDEDKDLYYMIYEMAFRLDDYISKKEAEIPEFLQLPESPFVPSIRPKRVGLDIED